MPESAIEHIHNAQQMLRGLKTDVADLPDTSGADKLKLTDALDDVERRLVKAAVAIEQGNLKPVNVGLPGGGVMLR